jgi:hypothetical protein
MGLDVDPAGSVMDYLLGYRTHSGGSGGDPIERALAIAARYRGSTIAER